MCWLQNISKWNRAEDPGQNYLRYVHLTYPHPYPSPMCLHTPPLPPPHPGQNYFNGHVVVTLTGNYFLGKMYNSRLFGGVKMLIGIVKCKDNW